MKKYFFLSVMLCVLLIGCGSSNSTGKSRSNEVKEYEVDEFSDIYYEIGNYDAKQFSKLTREEQYGGNTDEKKMGEYAHPLHVKFQLEKMKEYGIEYDQPIRIRGKLGTVSKSNLYCTFGPLDNKSDALEVYVVMDDDVDGISSGDVVVIEAMFTEDKAGKWPIMENGKIISR